MKCLVPHENKLNSVFDSNYFVQHAYKTEIDFLSQRGKLQTFCTCEANYLILCCPVCLRYIPYVCLYIRARTAATDVYAMKTKNDKFSLKITLA